MDWQKFLFFLVYLPVGMFVLVKYVAKKVIIYMLLLIYDFILLLLLLPMCIKLKYTSLVYGKCAAKKLFMQHKKELLDNTNSSLLTNTTGVYLSILERCA